MYQNDIVHIEPDFYSEEHSIIREIFAHIGGNKRGQSNKLWFGYDKQVGEITMEKIEALEKVGQHLLSGERDNAKKMINGQYPFRHIESTGRAYTDKQKMQQFKKDGFIDRYSGQKLVNPGFLKVLSHYMPEEFPYHSHWKMEECHNAYWELIPTIDHIYPVALGGADSEENWATTSMLHNSIKNNWTLEQLSWKLFDAGNYEEWDGLTELFVKLVNADKSLLEDSYIKKWYGLSKDYN